MILDEVDQLHDDDLLYDLPDGWNLNDTDRESQEELFARLDNRLVSRLHASSRICFEKYELADGERR